MSDAADKNLIVRMRDLGLTLIDLLSWLETPKTIPVTEAVRGKLIAAVKDLSLRVDQFRSEPSVLTVLLLGGTGVGKSTLLNALAGKAVASSSLMRPTTQFATVYHHRDIAISKLSPVLAQCRAVAHDRKELRYKILVDTPDIDGSVVENHERVQQILPIADAVLYVGSQEKYHDREGWRLLQQQRHSRAFAFVLNKWDRCLIDGDSSGKSPDRDFRDSLIEEGFVDPLIFRTRARQWAEQRIDQKPVDPANDTVDDFPKLEQWLAKELDERAIRDIKTRGIAGKIDELSAGLDPIIPPDWEAKKQQLIGEWRDGLFHGMHEHVELLLEAADKHAAAFERHFSKMGRSHLRGPFGLYLSLVGHVARLRGTVADSLALRVGTKIDSLAARCVASVPTGIRQSNQESLHKHLLDIADREHWPINALDGLMPDNHVQTLNDELFSEILADEIVRLEKEYIAPTGGRRIVQAVTQFLCVWLPWIVLGGIGLWMVYQLMKFSWGFDDLIGSIFVFGLTLGALHFLLNFTMPVHWEALRAQLEQMVGNRLVDRISPMYMNAIDECSTLIDQEGSVLRKSHTLLIELHEQLRRDESVSTQESLFSK